MIIDIRSAQRKIKIQKGWIKQVLNHVLESEGAKGELSVLFVDDDEIAALNQKYRRKKGPTDVLAFSTFRSPLEMPILGDIVISTSTAVRQAKVQRHSVDKEIAFLLIHGALHLLGYDHVKSTERKVMFKKQEAYLGKVIKLQPSAVSRQLSAVSS